jgi:AbrB family transcriptional regulator (stage V sporulation protein T)
MKATGIVRRIDDLGRVVIPKEIRRNLRIREGDPLELYTDGNSVCFKKYEEHLTATAEALKPVITAAKQRGLDINLYDEDWRITPSKTAPAEYEALGTDYYVKQIVNHDNRQYYVAIKATDDAEDDELRDIYIEIIKGIVSQELWRGV